MGDKLAPRNTTKKNGHLREKNVPRIIIFFGRSLREGLWLFDQLKELQPNNEEFQKSKGFQLLYARRALSDHKISKCSPSKSKMRTLDPEIERKVWNFEREEKRQGH